MAMIYENAVKAWASQKVDVPVDQIEKVDFDARREAFALVEKFSTLHNASCAARLKRLKTW